MLTLSNLSPYPGSRKQRKRVGRGPGSGHGKTSARGHKGQKSRSGGGNKPGFEGGQMPLQRRLPKRGFTNIFKQEFAIVNVQDLERFEAGARVDRATLIALGLVKKRDLLVKVLGKGELSKSLTVVVDKISDGARKKIEAAAGKVEAKE
ncbi:MAG: 50S ribosomal protein L15 [Deltaproteobacteria bacterium CG_4_10_14_3_um_filter_60_8]|nr:MAG: 50S ribosomal protein L15 [Desulfobacterales bacterium CG2_30_60_27]PIP43968.1 MAG: 50S ribosomal protein L15 [Deltaproteobacteria bacterium CG23_combo_of_CG06-09_8_20_14_all_60_8]PIY20847.1 MAG: 50S ribosomal protein L15 [Deltaproteobacteria bacterium CG_4_10_14_3_um_filter_60_8]